MAADNRKSSFVHCYVFSSLSLKSEINFHRGIQTPRTPTSSPSAGKIWVDGRWIKDDYEAGWNDTGSSIQKHSAENLPQRQFFEHCFRVDRYEIDPVPRLVLAFKRQERTSVHEAVIDDSIIRNINRETNQQQQRNTERNYWIPFRMLVLMLTLTKQN
jgi:hypothetical protein